MHIEVDREIQIEIQIEVDPAGEIQVGTDADPLVERS
jgi:hypothetical protein